MAALQRRGVDGVSYGQGACGEMKEDRRISIITDDWKNADAVIAALAEELWAQEVGGTFVVSLIAHHCGVLL